MIKLNNDNSTKCIYCHDILIKGDNQNNITDKVCVVCHENALSEIYNN